MKRILFLFAAMLLILTGCGGEEEKEKISPKEFESRVSEALSQMDTIYKIVSSTENEDGTYTIMVSNNAGFVIDGNKVTASHLFPYDRDDVIQLFTILIGCVDDSLSLGERNLVINELGLRGNINLMDYTKVIHHNDIMYTVHGNNDAILLKAEIK